MFSVTSGELSKALSERVIAARGEVMKKMHTLLEAEYGRDALAKVSIIHILIARKGVVFSESSVPVDHILSYIGMY